MATKSQSGAKSQSAKENLDSLTKGKRRAKQTQAKDSQAGDQMAQVQETAALDPPATSEVEVMQIDATEPSGQMVAEQPAAEVMPAQADRSTNGEVAVTSPLQQEDRKALALRLSEETTTAQGHYPGGQGQRPRGPRPAT